ncbi:MAG: peptidase S14 [Anaerolinea sp.]|nr:peptidase S14 [Anaerolinea sp.]
MKNKRIRCFEGTAQPHERFWRVIDAAESQSGEAEIDFDGVISEYSWYDDDITPKMFKDDLYAIGKGGPVTIKVNSGGGDVIAASKIRSILADYKGRVTMKVVGLAASAAVVIVLAGDRIYIQDTAYMMIHDPAFAVFMAYLDISTLKSWLAELETIKQGIQDTYVSKTGISAEKINRMMSETTWLTANEAVKLGFADEVLSAGRDAQGSESVSAAQANASVLKNYMNVPAALLNQQASEPVQKIVADDELSEEEQRLSDEVELNL